MKVFICLAFCALLAPSCFSQAKPVKRTAAGASDATDRLGMTCAQILEMSSTEWVKHFKEKDASADGAVRAIAA